MPGITRIKITDPFYRDERVALSIRGELLANQLYPQIMEQLGLPLESDIEEIRCTINEAKSRYDWSEGIDVILRSVDGSRFTLQEKFLDPPPCFRPTLTIEEYKASGREGAWFYCTAQWYFTSNFTKNLQDFSDWILIDFPGLRLARARGEIPTHRQFPRDPERGGPFFYWYFHEFPSHLVIAQSKVE